MFGMVFPYAFTEKGFPRLDGRHSTYNTGQIFIPGFFKARNRKAIFFITKDDVFYTTGDMVMVFFRHGMAVISLLVNKKS
jgi:hypothetical protein